MFLFKSDQLYILKGMQIFFVVFNVFSNKDHELYTPVQDRQYKYKGVLLNMRNAISGEGLSEPIGAFSQGVWAGQTLYMTGACGITDELRAEPDMRQETVNAMLSAEKILKSQGLTFENVVNARIYISDMAQFNEMNEAYKTFFCKPYPARATVEVSKLADGAHLEIVFVAYDPERK